jgi:hypothetical protein
MFDQPGKIHLRPTARLGAQVLSRESWRNAPFEFEVFGRGRLGAPTWLGPGDDANRL